jgi:hypothetical protein
MSAAWMMFAQAASSRKQRLMYFKAISIGYAVPHTDFDATVHSVFQSAINLCLTRGSKLLTLVASSEADLPQGIRVDSPEDFSFEIFRAGEQVTCRDDLLCFASSSLTIELRGAGRWKCDLPALQADMTSPAVATAWRCAWQTLNERQTLLGSEIIAEDLFRTDETIRAGVPRKAGEAMRNLFEAARRYDLTSTSPVRPLIGLGAGLTPSGDDLLVGYLAGLWCTVWDKSERVQIVANLGKAIIRLSRQTNDISRTYLYHASRGQVSSRLAALAEAICRGENVDRLLDIAEAAMRVGHTSGMDAVTGLLIGLATWIGPGTSDLKRSQALLNAPAKAEEMYSPEVLGRGGSDWVIVK